MDSVYYGRIDEIDVFYIDLHTDKPHSLNVLCLSNDVSVMWCSLIENDRAVECLLVSCVYAITKTGNILIFQRLAEEEGEGEWECDVLKAVGDYDCWIFRMVSQILLRNIVWLSLQ